MSFIKLKKKARSLLVMLGGWLGGVAAVFALAYAFIYACAFMLGIPLVNAIVAATFPGLVNAADIIPLLTSTENFIFSLGISIGIFNSMVPRGFYKSGRATLEDWFRNYFNLGKNTKADMEALENLHGLQRYKYNIKVVIAQAMGILGGFIKTVAYLTPVRIGLTLGVMYFSGVTLGSISILNEIMATIGFSALMLGKKKVPRQFFTWGQSAGEACTGGVIDLGDSAVRKIIGPNDPEPDPTMWSELSSLPSRSINYLYGEQETQQPTIKSKTSKHQMDPKQSFKQSWFQAPRPAV